MKQIKILFLSSIITLFSTNATASVNMTPIITYLLSETPNTPQALTFENNTTITIPDGSNDGPGVATSDINVSGAETSISKVTITLDITHTWISDLTIRLISPLGTSIVLSDVNIENARNYTNTTFDDDATMSITEAEAGIITGTYQPIEPLASFTEEGSEGTWTLQVEDAVWVDEGTLNSWSITIE